MGEEKIDLKNLKQRELLILVANNVERLDKKLDQVDRSQHDVLVKVNTLETKSKLWGSIAGLLMAIITIIIERLLGG